MLDELAGGKVRGERPAGLQANPSRPVGILPSARVGAVCLYI